MDPLFIPTVVYSVLKKDTDHFYGLKYPVDYGNIHTTRFYPFNYNDEYLSISRVDDKTLRLIIRPFEAESKIWDGTSNLPDKGTKDLDALFKASLLHDVLYSRAKAIEEASEGKVTEKEILAFADDCLKILAEAYGAKSFLVDSVYQVLRLGGNFYHKLRKYLGIFIFLCLTGCYTSQTKIDIPPTEIDWYGPVYTIEEEISISETVSSQDPIDEAMPPTNSVLKPIATTTTTTQPIQSSIEIESFGSPNCSKCVEDPSTQIKNLKLSNSGLSYKWSKGNLKNWGISNDHDAKALAIAGYSSDGKTFRCAKFDWISSDRLTRDFKNITEGYNGFKSTEFFNAKYRCFFIMTSNGKKRTNILID